MKIETKRANITQLPVDVIVNAANPSLLGGGGVDGAIHRAAGDELYEECKTLGGCETGEAKITDAYNIHTAKKIVHTVGPIYRKYSKQVARELLDSCYYNSLTLAEGCKSVAFPAISTGVYGYPLEDATVTAIQAIQRWVADHPASSIETVILVAFTEAEGQVLQTILDELS